MTGLGTTSVVGYLHGCYQVWPDGKCHCFDGTEAWRIPKVVNGVPNVETIKMIHIHGGHQHRHDLVTHVPIHHYCHKPITKVLSVVQRVESLYIWDEDAYADAPSTTVENDKIIDYLCGNCNKTLSEDEWEAVNEL